jgi:signal peptidase I
MKRPDQRPARLALTALFVVLAVVWIFLLRPQALGGPAAYVIVSGKSMEPTLKNGDLVVALRKSSYQAGDIVAYRIPDREQGAGALVIHRITGGSAPAGYVLQGDNRTGEDIWRPQSRDIAGDMRVRLPRVGLFLNFVRTPLGMALFGGVVAFFLVSTGSRTQTRAPGYARDVYALDVRFPALLHDSASPLTRALGR